MPRRRTAWIVSGLIFGAAEGPLLSMLVGHWHPDLLTVLVSGALLLVVCALHVACAAVLMRWRRREAGLRVAALVVLGSLLFVLPDSVDLPTTGDLWWTTGLERYAVYCCPYPFVAWLVASRGRRWIPALTCTAVGGCLVLGWPWLHSRLQNQTADVLRSELGVPKPMLYTVDFPGVRPVGGYFLDDSALSETYDVPGYGDASDGDSTGYNLAVTVFPASAGSPCSAVASLLFDSTGFGGDPASSTCRVQADGAWLYEDGLDDTTQIEREAGYFVAVTAGRQAPALESQFPALFASLRHPSNGQMVAIGLGAAPSPVE